MSAAADEAIAMVAPEEDTETKAMAQFQEVPAAMEDFPMIETAGAEPSPETAIAQEGSVVIDAAPQTEIQDAAAIPSEEGTMEEKAGDIESKASEPMDSAPSATEHLVELQCEQQGAPQAVHIPMAALVQQQKPKKAVSSYWLFACGMRDEIAREHEQETGIKAGLGGVAKLVSARWSTLPLEEKKVWEEKAAADKRRFDEEMQAYTEGRDPVSALRTRYQHLIPKKPLSAYGLYCHGAEQRAKAEEAVKGSKKRLMSQLADMWKDASIDEKAPFQEQYLRENLQFLEKQKTWQASPEYAEITSAEKAQEEVQKAVEAAKAMVEAEHQAREKRKARAAAKRQAEPAKGVKDSTPAKRPRTEQPGSASKVSRAKTANVDAGLDIDPKVLTEATKAGLEAGLRNLAARPEVLASGKSARAILEALRTSGGLVNPAKRVLLGV